MKNQKIYYICLEREKKGIHAEREKGLFKIINSTNLNIKNNDNIYF